MAVGNARLYSLLTGEAVHSDDHNSRVSNLIGDDGFIGNTEGILDGLGGDRNMHGGSDLVLAGLVCDSDPDFKGGRTSIERRADERDPAFDRGIFVGNRY